jgi:cyclophilin family peptidyl-prolyl cis-trans isomerase
MTFFRIALVAAMVMTVWSAAIAQDATQRSKEGEKVKNEVAVIETDYGNIEIEFFRDDAPKTVENFVKHAKDGYYNGVIFHRVVPGFVIQGGDPTGTGRGGESIYGPSFEDEIDPASDLYKQGYKRGIVAMANAGPNTNGSQFFICLADVPLPPNYTIFGRVISGMDAVDKIAKVETSGRSGGDKPLKDVVMHKVYMK